MTLSSSKVDNSRAWVVTGFLIIAGLFGGLGTWAAYANIAGAVIASGVVRVESNVKTVQHLTGGTINKILVANGDYVEAGALLIRLDETVIRANLAVTSSRLYEYRAQKARLEVERDAKTTLEFPSARPGQSKNPTLERIQQGQKSLFKARLAGRLGEVKLLNQQIEQYRQSIIGLEVQLASTKSQSDLIKEEIADLEPLFEKGLTPKSRLLALNREKARIDGEVGRYLSNIARTRGAIKETNLKILKTDIDFRTEVIGELSKVDFKIFELEETRYAQQDRLNNSKIKAPVSGQILNLAVYTIGGVISPATPILQIVPNLDRLIIEVRVATRDIDQIFLNQSARIQFSVFDRRTTPQLSAKIINISADRIIDKITGSDFFTVDLALDPGQKERLGDLVLTTGMPAEAFIVTGQRTFLNILLKPLTDQLSLAFRAG